MSSAVRKEFRSDLNWQLVPMQLVHRKCTVRLRNDKESTSSNKLPAKPGNDAAYPFAYF